MRSTSSRSFQAWAGGSGTSNELSNSMMLSLVPIANHVRRAEFAPDPAGAGRQPTSGETRRDELDPDGQAAADRGASATVTASVCIYARAQVAPAYPCSWRS